MRERDKETDREREEREREGERGKERERGRNKVRLEVRSKRVKRHTDKEIQKVSLLLEIYVMLANSLCPMVLEILKGLHVRGD